MTIDDELDDREGLGLQVTEGEVLTFEEFKRRLGLYMVLSHTSEKDGRLLLHLLRKSPDGTLAELPKDPRTLKEKDPSIRAEKIKMGSDGEYLYFGIKKSLLNKNAILFDKN